jgi:Mg-chelatase subunit ChlD
VIVLTDGEPNCDTEPELLTMLPAHWNERGVKTHVLGLPGSDTAADLLNAIAEAGGTGEFVSLGDVPADQLVHEVTARAR